MSHKNREKIIIDNHLAECSHRGNFSKTRTDRWVYSICIPTNTEITPKNLNEYCLGYIEFTNHKKKGFVDVFYVIEMYNYSSHIMYRCNHHSNVTENIYHEKTIVKDRTRIKKYLSMAVKLLAERHEHELFGNVDL